MKHEKVMNDLTTIPPLSLSHTLHFQYTTKSISLIHSLPSLDTYYLRCCSHQGPATINMSSSEYQKLTQRMDSLSTNNNNNNSQDNPEGLSQQDTAILDRPMTTPAINNNNNVSLVDDSDMDQNSTINMDANAYAEETKTGLGDGTTNVPSLDESSVDEGNNNNDDVNNSNTGGSNNNSTTSPSKTTQLPRIQVTPLVLSLFINPSPCP